MSSSDSSKMSSGHSAGLLNADRFSTEAEAIRREKDAAIAAAADAAGGNAPATTYRDKRGRKLEMVEEMMRQERIRQGKEEQKAVDAYEWGTGVVQKAQARDRASELAGVAAEPFARTADDAKLEAMRKERARDGDPMAHLARARMVAGGGATEGRGGEGGGSGGSGPPAKPVYKGPTPAPNRFGLRPGYRWDGIDRGNGWEDKVSQHRNAASVKKSASAAWSCSDM
jgi:pre-mRNA-splicing factor CWC26